MKFEPVELPAIGTKVVMGVEAKPIHHKSRYNHVGTWTQEPPRVLLFTEPIYSQHGEGTLCTAPECGGEMSEVSESFVDRINNTRRVYLHYTNWCGFCTKMKPVWAQVKETLAESAIEFYEVDEDVAKTPGVNGYPTILMIDENGYRHQYPGGSDFTTLREWCVAPALQKTN
jgi:thiol-disulfide isomerase/thioredoxin